MKKIITIVAALAAAASMSAVATASADSWHSNSGLTYPAGVFNGAFTANVTGGTYIHITSTYVVNCAASSTSTSLAGQLAGATGPASGAWSPAGTITPHGDCTIAGTRVTLVCNPGSFSATSYNGGVSTNLAGAGSKQTTGSLAVDCQLHLGNAAGPVCKNITGSVGYTLTNPSSVGGSGANPSADGSIGVPVATQSLTSADPVGVRCALPNGATTITTPAGGDPTYAVQGTSQPIVWFGS
jgi:hypothetical protein